MNNSIVFWYSSAERHKCGYCKNEQGNISNGMWAKYLTVDDYQNLIDRGWRRSGHYCYKPIMNEICCPMYTIKCDSLNFQVSKSQRKVIKKFNKFLGDGIFTKNETVPDDKNGGSHDFIYREAPTALTNEAIEKIETESVTKCDANQSTSSLKDSPLKVVAQVDKQNAPKPKSGLGADPKKPPCKKAKTLRMERKQEKRLKRGMSSETVPGKSGQKTLEDFLQDLPPNPKHKLRLELINTSRNDQHWENIKEIEFNLYTKYQMLVHNDPPSKCTMQGFLRFLVKSPVQFVPFSEDPHLGFGSFHQLYWLDDKLIAVGVIDILPKCISAVYFFYDPDYRNLTLGTYGSLREVEFSRRLHTQMPSIENYYLGFYIHTCPKMRYKGKLAPSFLLCPETYHWVPIEKCLQKIQARKYSKLEDSDFVTEQNVATTQDIDAIKVLCDRRASTFKEFGRIYGQNDMLKLIGQLIGQKCCQSLFFILD